MAGRNDAAIAAALEAVAQVVGQQPNANAGANAEVRMLETFLRNHPPTFKGRYDPDGAQTWLKEIERVFRVMQCTEVQKVCFGTHMLAEEADDWWISLLPILEKDGAEVTWVVLMREKVKVSRVVLSLTVPLLIRANKELMMRGDLKRKMLPMRLSVILVVRKVTRVMLVLERQNGVFVVVRKGILLQSANMMT